MPVLAALLAALGAGALVPDLAGAGPDPNSAVLRLRIFNDCPTSQLTTTNNYPTLIAIEDLQLDCTGFANLHNWRFSEDGANPAVFNNNDSFRFGADLVVSGTGEGESGLQLSPWWSQDVDGRLNVRTTDGEIACFGGRLPFYSFTAPPHNLHYVKGTPIHLEIKYLANDLNQQNPGTIEYTVVYNSTTYLSGVLPFDEGNPNEGRGTWGILDDARAGAHLQAFLQAGNPNAGIRAEWTNIFFEELIVPVEPASWGRIKSAYR
jgi:hypothetical protein